MRLPPRWLVACSVAGALVASSTAVLVMPRPVTEPAPVESVELPSFPTEPPSGDGPAVTGQQIAQLAATPALRRAEEIQRELTPKPTQQAKPRSPRADDDDDDRDDRIRKACRDGRMKGRVCRGR